MSQNNLLELLKWQLAQSDLNELVRDAEQAEAVGDYSHPARKRLAEAPKLNQYEAVFWEAYGECSTCRPPSFAGVAPIPFTAVLEYAKFWGFSRTETEALLKAIRALDNIYLDHARDQESKNT